MSSGLPRQISTDQMSTSTEPNVESYPAKLIREIDDKLVAVEGASGDLCIYRVPNKLREVKADAYNPRHVSIGPFHRGKTHLAAMGEHKWRYMLKFLQRPKDADDTPKCLKVCTVTLYDLEQKIRRCYAEKIDDHYDKDKFTELLLLDGCFILELFLRYYQKHYLNMKLKGKPDPIFNSAWMIPALRQDLALLENQIPFIVLQKLYDVIKPYISDFTPPNSVTSLALKFFQPMNQKALAREAVDTEDCNHLLDLLHEFYLLPLMKSIPNAGDRGHVSINLTIPVASGTSMNKGFSHGASQLLESGVGLENGSYEIDHLLVIPFDNGVLKIPPISIDQTTDSLFRNFIAFEQCHLKSLHQFTSYAILMKSLIRSKEDIKLLQTRKIIINQIGTEDKHLIDFGNILDHVHPKDFCYEKLCQDVNDFPKSWFHRHRLKVFWEVRLGKYITSLYSTYFSSPWNIIAFLAAGAALALTATQTYYAIHPR